MKSINLNYMTGKIYVQNLEETGRIIVSNTFMMLNADKKKTIFSRKDAEVASKDMNKLMQDLDIKRNFIVKISDIFKNNTHYLSKMQNCEICKGLGYVKDCLCGHDIINDLALDAFYGVGLEHCNTCDDTGWAPALPDEENSEECTCCGTTGRTLEDGKEIFKIGESYINKENIKILVNCLGEDVTLSADGKPLTPICIQFDGGYGYVGSISEVK